MKSLAIRNYSTELRETILANHGPAAAKIFDTIKRYCDLTGGVCYATQQEIADAIGYSRPTVNIYINLLCDRGYLVDRRHSIGGG